MRFTAFEYVLVKSVAIVGANFGANVIALWSIQFRSFELEPVQFRSVQLDSSGERGLCVCFERCGNGRRRRDSGV